MRPDPPEPPGGQDHDPPDLDLALVVTIRLLTDLAARFASSEADGDADLALRVLAVGAVLDRIRENRRGED
jgi:hypothetical protein